MARGAGYKGLGRAVALALVLCAPAMLPGAALAEADGTEPPTKTKPFFWREVWAGADVTSDGWLLFSGVTVAPFGHIHEQGLRLRVATGYGGYQYSGMRSALAFNPVMARFEPHASLTAFEASTGFADVLAGYLWRFDPLIVKVFGGVSAIDHAITPHDPENLAIGLDWGPKAVVELWLNMGDSMWGSLDLSYTEAHQTRSARTRVGYRLWPKLSVGAEARLNIDAQAECDLKWTQSPACRDQYRAVEEEAADLIDYATGGLFLRYEWDGGEISLSAGAAGSSLGRTQFDEADPYGTLAWIMQY